MKSPAPSTVDWLVIGSGFGGSVAALRLAEKGYDVTVAEQGRRFSSRDFAKSAWRLRRYLWMPSLGLRGILRRQVLDHVTVLCGVGVGGGSLVYANTLYRPKSDKFYEHPQWRELAQWREALAPHFDTAERMLGVVDYEGTGPSETLMSGIAEDLGVRDGASATRVGVFFGQPGETARDPYFGGDGPDRTGCVRCGQCMLGCRYGAKNTLDKNYLWLAERLGVKVEPDSKVVEVRPAGAADGADGYFIKLERPGALVRRRRRTIRARGIVFAAGTLGTNELLLKSRSNGSLPRLSERVGALVRTNSEAITAATSRARGADYRSGIAITRSVLPDGETHFTNNTFGAGGDALAATYGPLTAGSDKAARRRGFAGALVRSPLRWARHFLVARGWSKRSVIFTIMQDADNAISLELDRRGHVCSKATDGAAPSAWLPIANQVAELAAKRMGGYAQSSVAESLKASPTSAHFLGGAVIGAGPDAGVVDRHRRVFGYENMIVCDGSSLPANVGVNPSLTITAMAEEAMSHVPPANEVMR
ncbi:MAG: GMC family oxidoreductase [Phycisphaerales bacterium]|nr:GMC family oxidoreductase [Phycisphaerales bacterium]